MAYGALFTAIAILGFQSLFTYAHSFSLNRVAALLGAGAAALGAVATLASARYALSKVEKRQQQSEEVSELLALEFEERIQLPEKSRQRLVEDVRVWKATLPSSREAVDDLRHQLNELKNLVAKQKNEIVEVQKIDPILEATLKLSVENLTKRIDTLEEEQLDRWAVALVCSQVIAGCVLVLSAAGGAVFYILKHLR